MPLLGIQLGVYQNSFRKGVFMSKKLTLPQVCEGMVHYKQATGKSEKLRAILCGRTSNLIYRGRKAFMDVKSLNSEE